MKTRIKIVWGAAAFVLAGLASATTTWTIQPLSGSSPTLTSGTGNGQATVTVQGWADTGGSGNGTLQTQTLSSYTGGLGITNSDVSSTPGDPYEANVPEHAIDNSDRIEMVSLNFGAKEVNLQSFNIGYVGSTADNPDFRGGYTVMAYTAGGAPTLTGKYWNNLGSGWTAISNATNTTTGSKSIGIATYSSYWLIGAYNYLAAGVSAPSLSSAIKLASITGCVKGDTTSSGCGGTTTQVPEPGSLALLGLAFISMLYMRQRRQA